MTVDKRYELKEYYENELFIQDNVNNKVQYYSRSKASLNKIVDRLNDQEDEIKRLKDELFETRKEYILDTCDISDKLYLDEMIEEERKEIYCDVDGKIS